MVYAHQRPETRPAYNMHGGSYSSAALPRGEDTECDRPAMRCCPMPCCAGDLGFEPDFFWTELLGGRGLGW